VEAPTPGSVMLAAVLLKIGTYGILRFLFLPIFLLSLAGFPGTASFRRLHRAPTSSAAFGGLRGSDLPRVGRIGPIRGRLALCLCWWAVAFE